MVDEFALIGSARRKERVVFAPWSLRILMAEVQSVSVGREDVMD